MIKFYTSGSKVDISFKLTAAICILVGYITLLRIVPFKTNNPQNINVMGFVCFCLFVCLGLFVPLENFSLIWRRHLQCIYGMILLWTKFQFKMFDIFKYFSTCIWHYSAKSTSMCYSMNLFRETKYWNWIRRCCSGRDLKRVEITL